MRRRAALDVRTADVYRRADSFSAIHKEPSRGRNHMDIFEQLMKTADERRKHVRVPVEIHVECHCDGQPARVLRTLDLSEGGVFLVVDPRSMPGVDGEVELQVVGVLGGGETPPRVRAKVVRVTEDGVGLEFLP